MAGFTSGTESQGICALIQAHDGQLTTHDTGIKAILSALSTELDTIHDSVENILAGSRGATNCLEYDQAISWQRKQCISCESLPWDAKLITDDSTGTGQAILKLSVNDVYINTEMAQLYARTSVDYTRHYELKAGSKFAALSTASTTSTQGWLVPYSYGYSQEDDSATDFSLSNIINGTVPAAASNLFDSFAVYGLTNSSYGTSYVSNMAAANMTTEYYWVVIQARAKVDNVQIRTYEPGGAAGATYLATTSAASAVQIKAIKTGYGTSKTAAGAKNVLLKSGQYVYFRVSMKKITGYTYGSYGPKSITQAQNRITTNDGTIIIW